MGKIELTGDIKMRIGFGYDVHRLAEGRALILGGLEIPHEKGLLGHSDADVLLHAITDALLGSLALGDIGTHFPPSDARYKGISSIELLKRAYALVLKKGFSIENIDSTIVCEAPRLSPYIPVMARNIAEALNCPQASISIKAKTEEGLGFTGGLLGISAYAVALVREDK